MKAHGSGVGVFVVRVGGVEMCWVRIPQNVEGNGKHVFLLQNNLETS